MPLLPPLAGAVPERWQLIRDLVVLQIKLAIDALRDLALSPVSLVAGLLDVLTGGGQPRGYFYRVLLLGRRTEAWINLFGDADRVAPRGRSTEDAGVDGVVRRVEQLVIEQYERGGVTASAKAAIDRSLDAIARRVPRGPA